MVSELALLAALSVERGPGAQACMGQPELERAVERRLQRRVFVDQGTAELRLRVRFSVHDSQVQARIELSDAKGRSRGSRSLVTTGHCSKLDDSVALSLALLVDEPPEPEPEPESEPEPEPEPSAIPGAPAAPAPATQPVAHPRVVQVPPETLAPREPWGVSLGVAASGVWGVVPGVAPGLSIALRLIPSGFAPLHVQGAAYAATTAERDAGSGARFRLLRLGFAACPALVREGRGSLRGCVGQQLGWLSAEGYGFDHDSRQRRLSYALAFGAEGRLRLVAPVSIRGYLGAEVPLVRDSFASAGRDAQQLFRPTPVGISAEIGVEARIW